MLRKNYHGANKKHLRENFNFLLDFPLYVLSIHLHFLTLHIGNRHIYIYKAERLDLHQSGVKCLEGTTERSDGNRGRSPRIGGARPMCLEGTTPQDRPPFPPHNTTFRTAVQKLDAVQISSP